MSQDADRIPMYVVRPRLGIGPVDLGMTQAETYERMRGVDAGVEVFRSPYLTMHGGDYRVWLDAATDSVEGIEVCGLPPDGQADGFQPPIKLLLFDIDLFRTPADEVVRLIDASLAPQHRHTVTAETLDWPFLGLSTWRSDALDPAEDPAEFFESISMVHERLFDPVFVLRRRVQHALENAAAALWDSDENAREAFDALMNEGDLRKALSVLEEAATRVAAQPTSPSSFWGAMTVAADGLGCTSEAAAYRERLRPA